MEHFAHVHALLTGDLNAVDAVRFVLRVDGHSVLCWSDLEVFLRESPKDRAPQMIFLATLDDIDCRTLVAPVRAAWPRPVRIAILMAGRHQVPQIIDCLGLGADGIIAPGDTRALLTEARRAALAAVPSLEDDVRKELSERERKVLDLILAGNSNKEIGGEMGLSIRTVEAHRTQIYRKVGARSVVELFRRCFKRR